MSPARESSETQLQGYVVFNFESKLHKSNVTCELLVLCPCVPNSTALLLLVVLDVTIFITTLNFYLSQIFGIHGSICGSSNKTDPVPSSHACRATFPCVKCLQEQPERNCCEQPERAHQQGTANVPALAETCTEVQYCGKATHGLLFVQISLVGKFRRMQV